MIEVQQVDSNGNIVFAKDTKLSLSQIFSVLENFFPNINRDEDLIVGNFNGKRYSIRIKNITYLGISHPFLKKRIQISDLHSFFEKSLQKGYIPLLMGIYTFQNNIIFCNFNIEDYITKASHNSSAHIWVDDIREATLNDYFEKIDAFGNRLTAFSVNGIEDFFTNYLGIPTRKEIILNCKKQLQLIKHNAVSQGFVFNSKMILDNFVEEEKEINNFFVSVDKRWHGIQCYREMYDSNYRNKGQPEWAGFYLEYRFEKFIQERDIEFLIRYAQEKNKDGIDLDLFFPVKKCYGDLKAHSDDSTAVIGNDFRTITEILKYDSPYNHIYYLEPIPKVSDEQKSIYARQ